MKLLRELNAIWALTGREITIAVRNPLFLIFTLIFPIIFMGMLGGTLSQNLGSHLGFDLLRFIFVGMLCSTLYQGALNGMADLVQDREENFTQEMFVAPVSRYSIMLGKALGSSVISFASLASLVLMALLMHIHLEWADLGNILLMAPILATAGAAMGTFFIGFVQDPKVAGFGGFLLVFPQMFLSGALIPVQHSTGILGFFVHIMPMTYLVDLGRHLFYHGQAVEASLVQYSAGFDLMITTIFFLVFIAVGTLMFTRSEKNR